MRFLGIRVFFGRRAFRRAVAAERAGELDVSDIVERWKENPELLAYVYAAQFPVAADTLIDKPLRLEHVSRQVGALAFALKELRADRALDLSKPFETLPEVEADYGRRLKRSVETALYPDTPVTRVAPA